MKPTILMVGNDQALLQTRAALLRNNYESVLAMPEEAFQILQRHTFDLLLFCQSIPADRAVALSEEVKQEFPELPILWLRPAWSNAPRETDKSNEQVTIDFNPRTWMKVVNRLLGTAT